MAASLNTPLNTRFDVCIRGGGITGRTLALLLAKERIKVALVVPDVLDAEGHSDLREDVRAFALNQKSKSLLESLRCWPNAAHATPVRKMQVHGDDGGEVVFNAADANTDALAWIVDVPVLEAQLAQATQFQPQIEQFSTPQSAALTVVCEGKASSSRDEFGVAFDVTPYTQRAVATRLWCEHSHYDTARQWFERDSILGVLPMSLAQASDAPLRNSVAIVWSTENTQADTLMAMDDEAFCLAVQAACHEMFGTMQLASPRAVWPLQLAQTRSWVGVKDGVRWALVGDAAHTVHPLSGQGLNLGLADVAELASLLTTRDYWRSVADEKLLRRYERSRKLDAALLSGATDGLQRLFSQSGDVLQRLRNAGMNGFERSGPLKNWVARQAMGI
jgi:2-polyprenyl-6-methoxyphenol hydroxylase-like FAD-dependent oxidoreductase